MGFLPLLSLLKLIFTICDQQMKWSSMSYFSLSVTRAGVATAGHRGVRPFDWAPGTSLATGAPLSAGAWPPPAKRWQRNEKYFTRSITYGYGTVKSLQFTNLV